MKRFLTIFLLAFPLSLPAAEMNYDNLYNVRLVSDAFQARCFAQDEDGFIWIGTNEGLCCYDGYNVRAHYHPGSPDNVSVHSIVLDGGDRLFLGTETGLMSYDIQRGSYDSPDSGTGRIVRSLMLEGEKLWMGTTDGLYVYDTGSGVSRCLLKDADVYSVVRLRDRVFAGARNILILMLPATPSAPTVPFSDHESSYLPGRKPVRETVFEPLLSCTGSPSPSRYEIMLKLAFENERSANSTLMSFWLYPSTSSPAYRLSNPSGDTYSLPFTDMRLTTSLSAPPPWPPSIAGDTEA